MYCPNCAKRCNSEHKFCRSCGMHLPGVSKLVGLHNEFAQADRPENDPSVKRRTIGIVVAGVLIWLFSLASMPLIGSELLTLITFWLGSAVFTFGLFQPMLAKYGYIKVRKPSREALQSESQPQLSPEPAADVFPVSVTEGTTELLDVDPARRPNANVD